MPLLPSVPPSPALVFAVNLGATLALTGLSWFVQVALYPLARRVHDDGRPEAALWTRMAAEQRRRLAWAFGVPMVLELVTAALLAVAPPVWLPRPAAWGLGALVLVVWVFTFRLERPLLARLTRRFDRTAHQGVVLASGVSGLAWWTRSSFLLLVVVQVLR